MINHFNTYGFGRRLPEPKVCCGQTIILITLKYAHQRIGTVEAYPIFSVPSTGNGISYKPSHSKTQIPLAFSV